MNPTSQIPVDISNPGQVFGCLGILEAIELLRCVRAVSRFTVPAGAFAGQFEIEFEDGVDHVRDAIEFLRDAEASAVMPIAMSYAKSGGAVPCEALTLKAAKEQAPERLDRSDRVGILDAPRPQTRATLPARLATADADILVDSWCDGAANGRDNVKFWAGAGGYPGSALVRDAVSALKAIGADDIQSVASDPFAYTAPMSSSPRFDWRRDYIALDAGFSPNRQAKLQMIGYPLVELLALIGVENARPSRVKSNDKLRYRYGVWTAALPTSFARVALGAGQSCFPMRTFLMLLGWPGKENQARCIIATREE
jgi:CRISPR-associated protein Csx14